MRDRIWNNLYNIKFKAIYTCECSKKADQYGRYYSLFLAITSTSSIAAWTIWEKVPYLWAIIIAVSQFFHIAKPYFPFIKHDKAFLELSYEFETLYLEFEKLWFCFENEKFTTDEAERRFHEFRDKELNIEKTHKEAHCPKCDNWIKKANKATDDAININFSKGE